MRFDLFSSRRAKSRAPGRGLLAGARPSQPGGRRLRVEDLEDRRLLSASPTIQLFNASPALFVQNLGQIADESVRYAFQGSGANVLMTDAGPVFQVFQRDPAQAPEGAVGSDASPTGLADPQSFATRAVQFSATFDGAHSVAPVGLDQARTVYNYFVGDQSNWRTGVPTFQKVGYLGLYDGIDLYTWGRRDSLKYEFHVAPGADYRQIQVQYEGTEGLSLDSAGKPARPDLPGRVGRRCAVCLSRDRRPADRGPRAVRARRCPELPVCAHGRLRSDERTGDRSGPRLGDLPGWKQHAILASAIAVDGAGNALVTG